LKPVEEFREIIGQLRNLMVANMEMGLEPPPLSQSTLDYLQPGATQLHSLEDLRRFIGDCTRCKLSRGRTNLVFGEGSSEAGLVFVGEAPGREEDLAARPFVGEAGRLLTRIIENGMGLTRDEVYICNVVKCRPPKNRDPEPDEIGACIPFLKKQLELINPRVICILGRVAGQELLGKDLKITWERGIWHSFMGIRVMPTYHPAYILRNPSAKRQVWEDIQKIMKHLGLEVKKNG
jgi:DNA polymerase